MARMTSLRDMLVDWLRETPRQCEIAAALKDGIALLECAPTSLQSYRLANSTAVNATVEFVHDTRAFIKDEVLPLLRRALRSNAAQQQVVSPYAGGVLISHVDTLEAVGPGRLPDFSTNRLHIASFNPGALGLSHLSSANLLDWRIQAIGRALQQDGIDICILPGARFPPGATLPEGYPYIWQGIQSSSWGAVGALLRPELQSAIFLLGDVGCDRALWWHIVPSPGQRSQGLILCGFYPAPGGDVETWTHILNDYEALRVRFPRAQFLLLGDANTHLSYVLSHHETCTCSHCRQSTADKQIEQLLREAGLFAYNPAKPTHISGTAPDLIIGSRGAPLQVGVAEVPLAASDHHLLHVVADIRISVHYAQALGRVRWQSTQVWEAGLQRVESLLRRLTSAVVQLTECLDLRAPHHGGSTSKKQRRGLLDAVAWSRDALYVLVGHTSGAVSVSLPRPVAAQPAQTRLDEHTSFEQFKLAVAHASWAAKRRAVDHYVSLRAQDPGLAEAHMSKAFRAADSFEIALTDERGTPLSSSAMLSTLEADLKSRANNHFAQDPRQAALLERMVAAIRHAGAIAHASPTPQHVYLYCQQEVNDVVDELKPKKACIHGSYAALRASVPQGRELTWSLVNLGRHMGLTSTHWSLRQFAHIHKSGPVVVRDVACLRPLSLATDMASVQDALWCLRNARTIQRYCGPDQVGGVSDALSLILALLIHAQIRAYQGLATHWALTDLRWAFDVAILHGMLVACWMAGVVSVDWLLIDDFLAMDRQRVQLHGFCSETFQLGCGTAQGRRFSVFLMNALLRWLADDIRTLLPSGTCALLPSFACRALALANSLCPAEFVTSPPSGGDLVRAAVQAIQYAMQQDCAPWPFTTMLAARTLAALPRQADREEVLECLGSHSLGPLQYSDDLTAPCSGHGALGAILDRGTDSACTRYALRVRAEFNYGRGKTVSLSVLDSSPHPEPTWDTVVVHRLLGVLIDSALTFEPVLKECLCRGYSLFNRYMHAAECGGYSVPIVAGEVITRVEPVVLYPAPVLILVPGAERALNTMQGNWACSLLGLYKNARLPHLLLITQCGWELRLGSRMLLSAIMALARIAVLPRSHPLVRMCSAASHCLAYTWLTAAQALLTRSDLPAQILPIEQHPAFSLEQLEEARGGAQARRRLLKRYRWEVVRPVLVLYDLLERQRVTARYLPALAIPYATLQPVLDRPHIELLQFDLGPRMWAWYRCWCLARTTGCWPCSVFGHRQLPATLQQCPLCAQHNATIVHALCHCPGTLDYYADLNVRSHLPQREEHSELILTVLGRQPDTEVLAQCVRFVGRALWAGANSPEPDLQDYETTDVHSSSLCSDSSTEA